jgi:diphthamide biosynthesis methyltransferase
MFTVNTISGFFELYRLYNEMSLIFVSLERFNHYYIGMISNNEHNSLHFQIMVSFVALHSQTHCLSITQNKNIILTKMCEIQLP